MNNTFCLGIFLALIFFRELPWAFSAETVSFSSVQDFIVPLILTDIHYICGGCHFWSSSIQDTQALHGGCGIFFIPYFHIFGVAVRGSWFKLICNRNKSFQICILGIFILNLHLPPPQKTTSSTKLNMTVGLLGKITVLPVSLNPYLLTKISVLISSNSQ